jgi:hypothetical protein
MVLPCRFGNQSIQNEKFLSFDLSKNILNHILNNYAPKK